MDQVRPQVRIEKLPTPQDPDHRFCWVPSHDGKVIEFPNGDAIHSVSSAKYAAARALDCKISEIDFEIRK